MRQKRTLARRAEADSSMPASRLEFSPQLGGSSVAATSSDLSWNRVREVHQTGGEMIGRLRNATLALLLGFGIAAEASAALPVAPQDVGPPADVLAVRNVEVTFHTAGSMLPDKRLDLMMSIYADDARLTDTAHGNKVYSGKDQVLAYWRDVAGPFRPDNHWIGYTPAMRMHAKVTGDAATLYFECLWVDIDKNAIGAHSFSDMTLVRKDGRWQVKTIRVGRVDKL